MNIEEKFNELIKEVSKLNVKEIGENISVEEFKKECYHKYLKNKLIDDSIQTDLFIILTRILSLYSHEKNKDVKFTEELLKKNKDHPERISSICDLIILWKVKECGSILTGLLDKYFYYEFEQSEDKYNFKIHGFHAGLLYSIIFTLGRIKYQPAKKRLQELVKYLKINEPIIGETAEKALKELK